MNQAYRMGLVCAVVCTMWATLGSRAGAQDLPRAADARQAILGHVLQLDDILMMQRIEAIQRLSNIADPTLVQEFDIVTKLMAFVDNRARFEPERMAALEALDRMHRNGVTIPRLLDLLTGIVRDQGGTGRPNSIGMRMKSLGLVARVASQSRNMVEKQAAFSALTNLWQESGRRSGPNPIPITLRAALVEAIAGFPDQAQSQVIIQEAMQDREEVVRNSAIQAFFLLLQNRPISDARQTRAIEDLLRRSGEDPNASPSERVLFLRILDLLVRYHNAQEPRPYRLPPNLRETVEKLLRDGTDDESIHAGRFLVRAASNDVETVNLMLDVTDPTKELRADRDLGVILTHYQILLELLNMMASEGERGARTMAPQAEKVIARFVLLLDPALRRDVFNELRITLIVGLRTIPVEFNRQPAMEVLISNLVAEAEDVRPDMNLVKEIEDSLVGLSGQPPKRIAFRAPEAEVEEGARQTLAPRIEVPDVEAWEVWYQKHKDFFLPGKTPWLIPSN